jgi:putative FmdB family regulatory protein
MPLYDYQCKDCKHTFEGMYSIKDMLVPESTPCTECGGKVYKVILGGNEFIPGHNLNKKIPDSWNDVLTAVKKGNRGSTIETK